MRGFKGLRRGERVWREKEVEKRRWGSKCSCHHFICVYGTATGEEAITLDREVAGINWEFGLVL